MNWEKGVSARFMTVRRISIIKVGKSFAFTFHFLFPSAFIRDSMSKKKLSVAVMCLVLCFLINMCFTRRGRERYFKNDFYGTCCIRI